MAIGLFVLFVASVLGLSFYLGKQARSASGFFAAGGTIHWGVNGIAFAGDYLSAASFLGICGMIATLGYDGFLYSIGYLAGWIVALFVVAEPMKRLGKFTFTDALDSRFNSKGIQLAAGISTLIVSIFYLIPQMVGAGTLVTPLLGLPHWIGVVMVGTIVILIVATAGMASTTYVQFIKGGLLIIFSTVLAVVICVRGLSTEPLADHGDDPRFHTYTPLAVSAMSGRGLPILEAGDAVLVGSVEAVSTQGQPVTLYQVESSGLRFWYKALSHSDGHITLERVIAVTKKDGYTLVNGQVWENPDDLPRVGSLDVIGGLPEGQRETGALGPARYLAALTHRDTQVMTWANKASFTNMAGDEVTAYYPLLKPGAVLTRPGGKFKVTGSPLERLDFVSLMLALFFGTASLPHILIRYYTVPSPAAARKSTIVAIAAIGFFYVLTMFLGFGAMTSGTINPANSNMSAPLLAQAFGPFLFAIISSIAFATVLGTVSGLIVASAGAVAHDLLDRFGGLNMSEQGKVAAGKITAVAVGVVAIVLGILFKEMNVSFLVGWAFAVAASANLPAIVMMLFWKKTTARGITASIVVGIVSAIGLIMISPSMMPRFGLTEADALIPFNNPGIVSIPLSFLTLVGVSLLKGRKARRM